MTPTDAGFDWHDYLELARELSNPLFGDLLCEAKIRSSMSRSYYAAYWTARVYLEAGGFTITDKERPHELVWKEFKGKGKIKQGIFENGTRLKLDRVWADYERDCHCRVGDAERSLLFAECIIGGIRSLPAPRGGGAGSTQAPQAKST